MAKPSCPQCRKASGQTLFWSSKSASLTTATGVQHLFCDVPDAARRGGQKPLANSPNDIVRYNKINFELQKSALLTTEIGVQNLFCYVPDAARRGGQGT
jgi:hypothetical protein